MINVTPRSLHWLLRTFLLNKEAAVISRVFPECIFFHHCIPFCENNPSNFTNLIFQRLESIVIAYLSMSPHPKFAGLYFWPFLAFPNNIINHNLVYIFHRRTTWKASKAWLISHSICAWTIIKIMLTLLATKAPRLQVALTNSYTIRTSRPSLTRKTILKSSIDT